MLVLGRKRQEAVFVNGDIKITVLKVQGNSTRLGIEAPDSVQVFRGELADYLETPADGANACAEAEV